MADIYCSRNSRHTAKPVGTCGLHNSSLISVGYHLNKNFMRLFDICFDGTYDQPLYTLEVIQPANVFNQNGVQRPGWLMGGEDYFTSTNVDKLFTRKNQLQMLARALGSPERAEEFINEKQFLTRGHLAPKADFIFGTHQRATFYLLNASPQFQTFNAGNWAKIEESVRGLAMRKNLTLDVFTGTYGVLTFRDVRNVSQGFYLNYDRNNNGLVPVPELFFKVVIDRKSGKGVALVGVNNPFVTLKEAEERYFYCDDVSEQIQWVKKIRSRAEDGFYYACEVGEFALVAEELPKELRRKRELLS